MTEKTLKTIFYTGKGDRGTSALGKRKVSKDHLLFHALGTLDELNTWIGLCLVEARKNKKFASLQANVTIIQKYEHIA